MEIPTSFWGGILEIKCPSKLYVNVKSKIQKHYEETMFQLSKFHKLHRMSHCP